MRPFPHSIEYERALLGGMMLNSSMIPEVRPLINAGDFYRPDHGRLFTLILAMHDRGEPVDLMTVPERVHRDGDGERYGGMGYVLRLPEFCPATANLDYYARVVREKALARRLIARQQETIQEALDETDEIERIITRSSEAIHRLVGEQRKEADNPVYTALKRMSLRHQNPEALSGLPSGIFGLDAIVGGLRPGELWVLGARTGVGKTALGLQMASDASFAANKPAYVYSGEMDASDVMDRAIAQRSGIAASRLQKWLWERDIEPLERAISESERLFRVEDRRDPEWSGLVARMKQAAKSGISCILIDYIQIMNIASDKPRHLAIAEVTAALKTIALEERVCVLALAQLSRGSDDKKRGTKELSVTDLKDSGSIEQDADVILLLERQDEAAVLTVAKNRRGRTGVVELVYEGSTFTFYEKEG